MRLTPYVLSTAKKVKYSLCWWCNISKSVDGHLSGEKCVAAHSDQFFVMTNSTHSQRFCLRATILLLTLISNCAAVILSNSKGHLLSSLLITRIYLMSVSHDTLGLAVLFCRWFFRRNNLIGSLPCDFLCRYFRRPSTKLHIPNEICSTYLNK